MASSNSDHLHSLQKRQAPQQSPHGSGERSDVASGSCQRIQRIFKILQGTLEDFQFHHCWQKETPSISTSFSGHIPDFVLLLKPGGQEKGPEVRIWSKTERSGIFTSLEMGFKSTSRFSFALFFQQLYYIANSHGVCGELKTQSTLLSSQYNSLCRPLK